MLELTFSGWLSVKGYDENGYDIAIKAFFSE
jgi:hypothetical protein